MGYFMGIDLGSTTSKAVIVDSDEKIVGEGLTNTRSDYLVAVKVAEEEAKVAAKFNFLKRELKHHPRFENDAGRIFDYLWVAYKIAEFDVRFEKFKAQCETFLESMPYGEDKKKLGPALDELLGILNTKRGSAASAMAKDSSLFFRDVISELFMECVENIYDKYGLSFESIMTFFDKSIIPVENDVNMLVFSKCVNDIIRQMIREDIFSLHAGSEVDLINIVNNIDGRLRIDSMVGTGYGRQLLPFPKDKIFSEILCHGLGSHYFFPKTKTVLDIGGQDTKAIQIDNTGMVTSFSMNDRCAAGCGRYLGYIADQLGVNIGDLSTLALKKKKLIKISSTCTVFAGAELRSKLNLGEAAEDLVYSLERAMAKRAMSLVARSGGAGNEFTFSGGVAKNQSIVEIVKNLVHDSYGDDIKINVSANSIFGGALGAALFAKRKE